MSRRSYIAKLWAQSLDGHTIARDELQAQARAADDAANAEKLASAVAESFDSLHAVEPNSDLVGRASRTAYQAAPRRGRVMTLVPVGLAAAVGMLVWLSLPSSQPLTPAPAVSWIVTEARGPAWIVRGALKHPVSVGSEVAAGASVETAASSFVRLGIGDEIALGIEEDTALAIFPDSESGARVVLLRGQLNARSESHSRRLTIDLEGPVRSVRIDVGSARLMRRKDSPTVVACERGQVEVVGDTVSRELAAGEELSTDSQRWNVRKSAAKLALSLSDTSPAQDAVVVIRGQTNPGAVVAINGKGVRVSETGVFAHRLKLRDGKQKIQVVAEDVFKRRAVAALSLERPSPRKRPETSAPPTKSPAPIKMRWEWESPKKPKGPKHPG